MTWQPWPKSDDRGLARYVLAGAAEELRLPVDPIRLPVDHASRRALVEAIYDALREKEITYRLEDYQREPDRQRIRTPHQVLRAPGVGTCLDLAAVFCGICLGHDLLPILIVMKDHALAAVSLTHGRRDWQHRTRKERALFEQGVLRPAGQKELGRLLDAADGAFLPVECTGFSRSLSLVGNFPEGRERDEHGLLSFQRAIAAAREQLASSSRELAFAIDVAWLHESGYEPLSPESGRATPFAEAGAAAGISIYGGATALRLDYRQEAADILRYYNERFVGREKEHGEIVEFVRGAGPGGGGAYLLIEAPGGIGKSAFMASLVQRAEADDWPGETPSVVYFFIRQQGGRNTPEAFLQAVNSQLLEHLGLTGGTPAAERELRAQFTQLWAAIEKAASAKTPMLLLVDGLDEMARAKGDADATIADLLPTPVNPAIRVVVSSRPNPPAKDQVRREHPLAAAPVLALRTFDLAGVRRLLESVLAARGAARHPDFAEMADALTAPAQRVLALTRGEPLFARFVCDELAQGGLVKLAALERNPPAYAEDYFLRELRALRKSVDGEVAWQVLGVLSVARGGLTRDDLAGITNRPPRLMNPALTSIDRYTLGNLRLELMHARLRELVGNEFTADERQGLSRSILAWCASFAKRGWPADTPDYVLDQYAAHLAALGDGSALIGLLDKRWLDCHRARAGTVSHFVRDATLALEFALRDDEPSWMHAARASYVLGTLRSVAGQLPGTVIACLARFGRQQEAEGYAELVEHPLRRCEAFARLAAVARDRGDAADARRLSRAALDALAHKELLGELDEAYATLCEVLADLGDTEGLETALRVASAQEGPDDWAPAGLAAVVCAYSRLHDLQRVREVVQKFGANSLFLECLGDLAVRRKDHALLRAIADIGPGDQQPQRLAIVGAALYTLGDLQQARALAGEAIARARTKRDLKVHSNVLARLARHGMQEEAGKMRDVGFAEARGFLVSRSDSDGFGDSGDLAAFAKALADAADADGLAVLQQEAEKSGLKTGDLDEFYADLAGSYARLGLIVEAKAAARALEAEESDGSYEAIAWLNIIRGLCETGRLAEAMQAAGENTYETRIAGYGIVAVALASQPGREADAAAMMRRAIAVASGLGGDMWQAKSYADLAVMLADRDQMVRARAVLARAEAEVKTIARGGMVFAATGSLVKANARLGAFETAETRMALWEGEASLREIIIQHANAAGRTDVSARQKATLMADAAATVEVDTILVAAAVASADHDTGKSDELLGRAHDAARAVRVSPVRDLCAVVKAYVAAGKKAEARLVLDVLKLVPEWSALASAAPGNGGEVPAIAASTQQLEADGEEEESDNGATYATASHAIEIAAALHSVGEEQEARKFAMLALATMAEDPTAGSWNIEYLAEVLADSGQLRERFAELRQVIESTRIEWQMVELLARVARVALSAGDTHLTQELLAQALRHASTGGRLAFFELVPELPNLFRALGVVDPEWAIFELCEEIDDWWQAAPDLASGQAVGGLDGPVATRK